jgi:hypothetical protein
VADFWLQFYFSILADEYHHIFTSNPKRKADTLIMSLSCAAIVVPPIAADGLPNAAKCKKITARSSPIIFVCISLQAHAAEVDDIHRVHVMCSNCRFSNSCTWIAERSQTQKTTARS